MLYTRKGDSGTSGLFGSTERIPKSSPIYDALGTLDELNSLLGFCRAQAKKGRGCIDIAQELLKAQERLFVVQAEIAGAKTSLPHSALSDTEHIVDTAEAAVGNPHAFVIPGATAFSGLLDFARAVSRRAERTAAALPKERALSPAAAAYLNRLSSLLYALARYAARTEGKTEEHPVY